MAQACRVRSCKSYGDSITRRMQFHTFIPDRIPHATRAPSRHTGQGLIKTPTSNHEPRRVEWTPTSSHEPKPPVVRIPKPSEKFYQDPQATPKLYRGSSNPKLKEDSSGRFKGSVYTQRSNIIIWFDQIQIRNKIGIVLGGISCWETPSFRKSIFGCRRVHRILSLSRPFSNAKCFGEHRLSSPRLLLLG